MGLPKGGLKLRRCVRKKGSYAAQVYRTTGNKSRQKKRRERERPINEAHAFGKLGNRIRRLARRLVALEAARTAEVIAAGKSKRDPNIAWMMETRDRLERRQSEILSMVRQ